MEDEGPAAAALLLFLTVFLARWIIKSNPTAVVDASLVFFLCYYKQQDKGFESISYTDSWKALFTQLLFRLSKWDTRNCSWDNFYPLCLSIYSWRWRGRERKRKIQRQWKKEEKLLLPSGHWCFHSHFLFHLSCLLSLSFSFHPSHNHREKATICQMKQTDTHTIRPSENWQVTSLSPVLCLSLCLSLLRYFLALSSHRSLGEATCTLM